MNVSNLNKTQTESIIPWQQNVSIPHTWQIDMEHSPLKRPYRVFVYKPDIAPPPEGYPVIYALDANSVFSTFVEAMRVQMQKPEKTGVHPAIIVGIGYQTEQPFCQARVYDFTRPLLKEDIPPHPAGKEWPPHGGAEYFLTFIKERVKPEIERNFPVNMEKQALFGHSLGGLFVLQTLFSEPEDFQTYIAGSPSIHWDAQYFKVEESSFVQKLQQSPRQLQVLIGVGELEKQHSSGMNKNAENMYKKLERMDQYGLRVQFREFLEESHVSVLLPLINRAIRLVSL